MEPERSISANDSEEQDERRDAAPADVPEPDMSDYNLPFTD